MERTGPRIGWGPAPHRSPQPHCLHLARGRLPRTGRARLLRRERVRADEPAESLAVILLYAVLFSARRGVTIGRPPGSTALSRLALQVTLRGMRP